MKTFLLKTSLLCLLTLPLLVVAEWKARENDENPLHFRSDYFYKNASSLEGAVFGPSLTARAVNPALFDRKLACLATAGSAINVDYALFLEANEQFTPQFVLFDVTAHYLSRKNDRAYFDLKRLPFYYGVGTDKLSDFFLAHPPLREYLNNEEPLGRYNTFGFETEGKLGGEMFAKRDYDKGSIEEAWEKFRPVEKMGKLEPEVHRESEQLLKEAIEICRRQGTKVIFFSPPKYYLFNEFIKDRESMRLRNLFLEEVVDDEFVFFWDLAHLGTEDPRNFSDFNHVSPVGATLTTIELNKRLNELLAE